jgi:hypothetical protein
MIITLHKSRLGCTLPLPPDQKWFIIILSIVIITFLGVPVIKKAIRTHNTPSSQQSPTKVLAAWRLIVSCLNQGWIFFHWSQYIYFLCKKMHNYKYKFIFLMLQSSLWIRFWKISEIWKKLDQTKRMQPTGTFSDHLFRSYSKLKMTCLKIDVIVNVLLFAIWDFWYLDFN